MFISAIRKVEHIKVVLSTPVNVTNILTKVFKSCFHWIQSQELLISRH